MRDCYVHSNSQARIDDAAALDAFRRCGSPVTGGAESLAQAANAMVDGDHGSVAVALREAATASTDAALCPPKWLRREADRRAAAGV